MSKTPVSIVKDQFGDKAKLVSAVQSLATDSLWINRTNEGKGLGRVSNAKLLRLHGILSEVKEKFGDRAKLIASICDAEKRSKDEGYRRRLEAYPVPRLYDMYRASQRRTAPKSAAAAGRAAVAKVATAKKEAELKAAAKLAKPAAKKGAPKKKK